MNMTRISMLAADLTFGERAAYAGRMLLIGLGAVFGVLALLWGCLVLFRLAVVGATKPNRGKKQQEQAQPDAAISAPAAPPVAAPAANDEAVIAAITAAVAATLAAENGGAVPAFRVVSYRKVKTVSGQNNT